MGLENKLEMLDSKQEWLESKPLELEGKQDVMLVNKLEHTLFLRLQVSLA